MILSHVSLSLNAFRSLKMLLKTMTAKKIWKNIIRQHNIQKVISFFGSRRRRLFTSKYWTLHLIYFIISTTTLIFFGIKRVFSGRKWREPQLVTKLSLKRFNTTACKNLDSIWKHWLIWNRPLRSHLSVLSWQQR